MKPDLGTSGLNKGKPLCLLTAWLLYEHVLILNVNKCVHITWKGLGSLEVITGCLSMLSFNFDTEFLTTHSISVSSQEGYWHEREGFGFRNLKLQKNLNAFLWAYETCCVTIVFGGE